MHLENELGWPLTSHVFELEGIQQFQPMQWLRSDTNPFALFQKMLKFVISAGGILTSASQPNPISRSGRRESASAGTPFPCPSFLSSHLDQTNSKSDRESWPFPRGLWSLDTFFPPSTYSLSDALSCNHRLKEIKFDQTTNNGGGNNIKAFAGSRRLNSHLVSPPTPAPVPGSPAPGLLLILIWSLLLYLIASLAQCIAFCSRPVF